MAATEELFHEAMAHLASGVVVLTARRAGDGEPCGLAATSVSSYSAEPPSLLASIDHRSRCHDHLVAATEFGVHILGAEHEELARTFASRGDDKFAGLDWRWDGEVPEVGGALVYLRCRREATFAHYDHTVLIGDVIAGEVADGEPLLYARRRMDWSLRASL